MTTESKITFLDNDFTFSETFFNNKNYFNYVGSELEYKISPSSNYFVKLSYS